jgi:hypothetical protein
MAIIFLSSLRETHPQSSHFTDPQSLSKSGPPPSAKVWIRFGSNLLEVAFTQPRTSCVWSDDLETRYGHPQSMAVKNDGSYRQLSACTDFLSAKGAYRAESAEVPTRYSFQERHHSTGTSDYPCEFVGKHQAATRC